MFSEGKWAAIIYVDRFAKFVSTFEELISLIHNDIWRWFTVVGNFKEYYEEIQQATGKMVSKLNTIMLKTLLSP